MEGVPASLRKATAEFGKVPAAAAIELNARRDVVMLRADISAPIHSRPRGERLEYLQFGIAEL